MSTSLVEREQKQIEAPVLSENTRPRKVFIPRADIIESQDKLILRADMPGVSEDNVDITLENNVLTINGTVEDEETGNYTLAYSEYGVGDYRRSFTLSNAIDRDGIEAMLKNGVLTLILPKSKALLPKKVSIQSS